MKHLKLDTEEKELLEALEGGEWKSAISDKSGLERYASAARRTLRKDKRVNIRISERDLTLIQKIAVEEGIPYQTLISSIIHKYVDKKIAV
jgi:predicted DNA binding CopG/RHH family protein